VTGAGEAIRTTFLSLRVRNYRLFFVGQGISLCGTWMQRVAQSWLVLELTGSGTAVGALAALQFLPTLFLTPLGGLLADRTDKRRLLFLTQSAGALSALILGGVVIAGVVELWMVYALTLMLGLSTSLDSPVRQTFVLEMVGRSQLTNAVSLHSTLVNAARVVGPALAGVLIVTVGIGWCFVINAATYLALIAALWMMRVSELKPEPRQQRSTGQLRAGFAYVRRTPRVAIPLLLMAISGLFAYEYQVVLPLFARFTFGGDAGTFATMTVAMGVGAVFGGLVAAARANTRPATLGWIAIIFGLIQVAVALAPSLEVAFAALVLLGAASVSFIAIGNSTLQLSSAPAMRGRVMGLYIVAFVGTTPIGGPLMGWIGEHLGPRHALAIGGIAMAVGAAFSLPRLRSLSPLEIGGPDRPASLPPEK
jgi:MFS family permease